MNCAADMAISTPSVITIEEQFGIEMVTVVLEWTKEDHVQYNVTTFPHVPMWYINDTTVQLRVPYNIPHNVSVVATLCGRNATNITELHYGKLHNYDWQEPLIIDFLSSTMIPTVKCKIPPKISSATGFAVLNNYIITDHDIMSPALVGSKTSVTISCSEQVGEFNKTVSIICMDDAKWHLQDDYHTKCEGKTSCTFYLICHPNTDYI